MMGSLTIVENVLSELDRAAPDVRVTQVKEKLGSLRVYTEDKTDDMVREIVGRAEVRSATICEVCGEAGNLFRDDGWVRVRCVAHDG